MTAKAEPLTKDERARWRQWEAYLKCRKSGHDGAPLDRDPNSEYRCERCGTLYRYVTSVVESSHPRPRSLPERALAGRGLRHERMLVVTEIDEIRKAAAPLAVCKAGWKGYGYGGNYTCLDREVDIANPEHETTDWWPNKGPCKGCELLRVLHPERKSGTLSHEQRVALMREEDDRREYERLTAKYGHRPRLA